MKSITTNRFCDECDKWLRYDMDKKNNILYKVCKRCNEKIKDNSKILFFTNKKAKKIDINIIRSMIFDDHTYPRMKIKISNHDNCNNDILKYYVNKDLTYVYVCDKCHNYWTL